MNANRYILILIVLIVPVFATAQKIGEGKYRVSTGDTTKIVNPINDGLNSPESKFLFSASGKIVDSLYSEIQPNMTSAQAMKEVNDVLQAIKRDQSIQKAGNASLSYRLSTEYIASNKKEKRARAYADSLLLEQRKISEKELALNYLMYGGKPSYYVNAMPVSPEIANMLMPGDVISRDIKTNTPNPNGEIWLVLTERAMRRLKLPVNNVDNSTSGYRAPVIYDLQNSKKDTNQPVNRVDNTPKPPVKNDINSSQPQPQTGEKPRTVVRARTINNQPVEVKSE